MDGHLLIENRHGLIVDAMATEADGRAERDAGLLLLHARWKHAPWRRRTLGADKAYDVHEFIDVTRALGCTPHVAQKTHSAIDRRTTRHAGYAISQQKRKLVEQVFGWMKTVGGLRKLRHRGCDLVDWIVTFTAAAYNLIRLRTLLARA